MKRLMSAVLFTAVAIVGITVSVAATVDSDLATLRKAPLNQESTPPPMSKTLNTDIIPARSYPMQPPLIPHKIDNYQVDIKANKCMSCHARSRVADTQATMISVTHFMDRDGNFLAELSPRRYFCQQCHVTQSDAKLLVDTDFTDLDSLIGQEQ
ncbi:nitrate reductase cytochrome c-type subunit [Photobacterium indicum]|jgi:nitrate reductase (cytochrome), electron transfer subunit|uniref:Periplasmic nitrate reductase, electron transfer subunit n=1 Tax=Photobacterium indicum TaxID=81447 RepID=A0A2T3L9V6_9GAMM|nr:nitrate reductase cytochrome c-type subunit [Photobacterium indicum]PSV48109.1 periplasmic nitrate reductase electron transfer subunit [Photobacterium indicum]